MTTEKRAGGRGKDGLILGAVLLVGLGAVAVFGFYQDEVKAFFRLEGWNLAPVTDATRQFVRAAAVGDGERVSSMVAPGSQTVQVAEENGKVMGLMVPAYGGPRKVTLKQVAPSENPEIGPPKLVALNGGSVSQTVTFPTHTMDLGWDKTASGWKIANMSWRGAGE